MADRLQRMMGHVSGPANAFTSTVKPQSTAGASVKSGDDIVICSVSYERKRMERECRTNIGGNGHGSGLSEISQLFSPMNTALIHVSSLL